MKYITPLTTTIFTTFFVFSSLTLLNTPPVLAQSTQYQTVNQLKATTTVTPTFIYPGRITSIDFSDTDQIITYINLSDNSRTTYTTDSPLNNGKAQTIFLKQIKPINFPGATRSHSPNLVVKTLNPKTQKIQLYNFQIIHKTGTPNHLGIKIMPNSDNNTVNKIINIGQGRTATLDDIERGLRYAILRGYTTQDDPIVLKIRNFLATVSNSNISIAEAAKNNEIDLAILIELGRIALEPLDVKTID